MCIIAVKPKNVLIPRETLERCYDANPHGAGFVAARGGVLTSRKGFFTFDSFWEAYEAHAKDSAVIHFRIKTHGNTDAEMCHPFRITDQLYVAHNGIIDIDTDPDKTKSDTWHFVERVLKPELEDDPSPLYRGSFQYLLACTIGYSKLAFLNAKGVATIINKQKGEMNGEVWYSNSTYKAARVVKQYHGYSAYSEGAEYSGGKKQTTGQTSCSTGQNATTGKVEDTTYATLEAVPVEKQWVIPELREFGFDDESILAEINADTAVDFVLDLMVAHAERQMEEPSISKEEVAEEVMLLEDAEDEEGQVVPDGATEKVTQPS